MHCTFDTQIWKMRTWYIFYTWIKQDILSFNCEKKKNFLFHLGKYIHMLRAY